MKTSPIRLKQKLSPKAAAAKKKRDLASALTKKRADYKASSQRARRKAIKDGVDVSGKDYDHKTASFKSVKSNRGNGGKGTKSEGNKNYKIKN
tara:strand:- start:372 stop:650 length:279 start_codon:yes stop_codon:yes gene_type:complete